MPDRAPRRPSFGKPASSGSAADDVTLPSWLKDGSFLWLSDRSGWRHLYHYAPDGTLIKQVTSGKWEMRTLHGVDESGGWVYFSGTERSPIGGDVYRIKLDGSGLRRLSTADGTHSAEFSPSFGFYVDTWSNVTTPPQTPAATRATAPRCGSSTRTRSPRSASTSCRHRSSCRSRHATGSSWKR